MTRCLGCAYPEVGGVHRCARVTRPYGDPCDCAACASPTSAPAAPKRRRRRGR